jgi:zinc protease
MILRAVLTAFVLLLAAGLPARAVEVQRVVSPGGIEAWLVEDHSNPIISLELAFRGGAALDSQGREGLAVMVAGLIDEGAGELDSQAFRERLEDLSIRLSFDASLDQFDGTLRTLTEHRDTAFDLLRLALTAPRFDDGPVERIRGQILAGLRQSAEDPNEISSRTIMRLYFPDHPYGRPVEGTPESVAAIETADLKRFVAERFGRDMLKIGVVGDIDPETLAALLDRSFLALPAKAAAARVADTQPQAPGEVVVIEKSMPQSVVSFGHVGIKRADPDFYTAYVVNYILGGGGFSARLYEEIREKRGLAYSVYSYLSPLEHAGLVFGGVATQNGRVGESISLIRQEWARMAAEGPSAEELDAAKTFLTGSYPLRQSSSGRIAGMLLGIQLQDLGIDYINRRNSLIEAVTLEDARRVAKRLYDESLLTFVIVGLPDGVSATREAPGGS